MVGIYGKCPRCERFTRMDVDNKKFVCQHCHFETTGEVMAIVEPKQLHC